MGARTEHAASRTAVPSTSRTTSQSPTTSSSASSGSSNGVTAGRLGSFNGREGWDWSWVTTYRGAGYCNSVTHNAIEEVEENKAYSVFATFVRCSDQKPEVFARFTRTNLVACKVAF